MIKDPLQRRGWQKGFTMLEMMIVITVLTIILSFSLHTMKSFVETLQKRMFISQLQSDLYYAQSYAINRQEHVVISFSVAKNEYQAIVYNTREPLYRRKIPTPIYLREINFLNLTITPEGTVTNFGTVAFALHNQRIKLTIYIGGGRFIVQE